MPNHPVAAAANSQRLLRFSSAITSSCSAQSISYGKCVVAKSESANQALTKDACGKEFAAFSKCIQTALKQKK